MKEHLDGMDARMPKRENAVAGFGAPRVTLRIVQVGGLAILLCLLTRWLDFGRHSPWLDEINNWLIAKEYGWIPYPGHHRMSFWAMAAGLKLSDSTWGLRLFSAAFGSAAVLAGALWAAARLGPRFGVAAALALGLSPFGIFYSQDANHYAPLMLAGVLAAIGVDAFLEGWRPGSASQKEQERAEKKGMNACNECVIGGFVMCLCMTGLAAGFHPFGGLTAVALGACLAGWMWVRADRLPPRNIAIHVKRAGLGLIAVVAIALLGPRGLRQMAMAQGMPQPNELAVGLNWPFLSRLGADAFGALYRHKGMDVALGLGGMLLCVWGWVWTAIPKRKGGGGAPFAAAGAGLVILSSALPFFLLKFSHYFSPRYLAAAIPAGMMGAAIGAVQCLDAAFRLHRNRRELKKPVQGCYLAMALGIVACLWVFGFAARSLEWRWNRVWRDHQPSYQALDWIRRNTPDKSIVLTRHRYSARALTFLWNRRGLPPRTLIPLSYVHNLGAPSIQQAEEALQRADQAGGQPVYSMSLIEDEERLAPDWADWLKERTSVVAEFPSGSEDEFVPINWGIRVRKVLPAPSGYSPLSLPRSGVWASGLLQEDKVAGGRVDHATRLGLPPGTGAVYKFNLTAPADGLCFQVEWRWIGKRPRWLVAGLDELEFFLWDFSGDSEQREWLKIERTLEPGMHRLDVAVVREEGGLGLEGQCLVIEKIIPLNANNSAAILEAASPALTKTGTLLSVWGNGRLATDSPRGEMISLESVPLSKPVSVCVETLTLDWTAREGGLNPARAPTDPLDKESVFPAVIVKYLAIGGLGGRALEGRIKVIPGGGGRTSLAKTREAAGRGNDNGHSGAKGNGGGGQELQILAPLDWTSGRVMCAGVVAVSGEEKPQAIQLQFMARPRASLRPWNPTIEMSPAIVLRPAKQ